MPGHQESGSRERAVFSSATFLRWDSLEIFEDEQGIRYFILWEIKGTDKNVEQMTHADADQLNKTRGTVARKA